MADGTAQPEADSSGEKPIGEKTHQKRPWLKPPWTSKTAPRNGGRPKGSVSLVARLKQHLEENPEDVREIVDTAIAGAKAGDQKLLAILLDRVDGPVKQQIEHSGALDISSAFLKENQEVPLDGDTSD